MQSLKKKGKKWALIGAQWGDEGKGKVTDYLAKYFDLVVRYQGGNNAGHTIYLDGKKIVLHHLPSGVTQDGTVSFMAPGMVCNPQALVDEIRDAQNSLSITPANLKIAWEIPLITSFHRLLDQVRENGQHKIGTTCKGIGPTYEDKVARKAIRFFDLLHPEEARKKLTYILKEKLPIFEQAQVQHVSVDQELVELQKAFEFLHPFMVNGPSYFQTQKGSCILFEGAQGVLLDLEFGTYPYVTSGLTSIHGIGAGTGYVGALQEVIGICKAYTTRVGAGPFPTELHNTLGEHIQEKGGEFGATTGRRRRCGYLDLPLLRYAKQVSGLTQIALTKLDILEDIEPLKVCHAYEIDGEECKVPNYIGNQNITPSPLFQEFPKFKMHSAEMTNYLEYVERESGIPISFVGTGPNRDDLLIFQD